MNLTGIKDLDNIIYSYVSNPKYDKLVKNYNKRVKRLLIGYDTKMDDFYTDFSINLENVGNNSKKHLNIRLQKYNVLVCIEDL